MKKSPDENLRTQHLTITLRGVSSTAPSSILDRKHFGSKGRIRDYRLRQRFRAYLQWIEYDYRLSRREGHVYGLHAVQLFQSQFGDSQSPASRHPGYGQCGLTVFLSDDSIWLNDCHQSSNRTN